MQVPDYEIRRFVNVLFLGSEAPNLKAAGGIYFHRLFSDWPPELFRVVTHCMPSVDSSLLNCVYRRISLPFDRLNKTRFWKARIALRAFGATRLVSLESINSALEEFRPDIIVTLMQDSWMYDLASRFADYIDKPLVIFIHDLAHGFEPLPSLLQPLQLKADKQFLKRGVKVYVVSEGMKKYVSESFGVQSEVLLPPRSNKVVGQCPSLCKQLKIPGRLSLGFAGGLHYGYGEQLLRMLPALREIGAMVHCFGAKPPKSLSALSYANDVFQFHGYLPRPEDAWMQITELCDAVLLPYLNPPGYHDLQYRTHFPSKLGEMLSLGIPVFATGPESASGISYLRSLPGSAFIVSNPHEGNLQAALMELQEDGALRECIAKTGQEFCDRFNVEPMQRKILADFSSIAKTQSQQL